MKEIRVSIHRGTPGNGLIQNYTVEASDGMSVMDVLKKIYEEQDQTLAYFSHEACHQKACGKCLIKLNGRVCLACGEPVKDDVLEIGPWKDDVVRDLICR